MPAIDCDLGLCAGRILSADVFNTRQSPALDVSAMDGYAVKLTSISPGVIRISQDARIGLLPTSTLAEGSAARIVTGAPVPPDADTVIKRELVEFESDSQITLTPQALSQVKVGQAIRRKGENAQSGNKVLRAGCLINGPAAAAIAASGSARTLRVHRPLRVAIITTGDELVSPTQSPHDAQLWDSNGPGLASLLASFPGRFLEISNPLRLQDDPQAITAAALQALQDHDCVVFTGGVSMGHSDFVPKVVEQIGGTVVFHRINQRPGKPLLGAVTETGKLIMGLPGNPQSVLVTARRILWPVLMAMSGLQPSQRPPRRILIRNPDDASLDLWWYRFVHSLDANSAELLSNKGSGDILALASSAGFVEVPPGTHMQMGAECDFYPWSDVL